ncbi:hypothetical protein LTR84_006630 [Exophiala bonariae]|uniref:Zn(2)-C6 fungal-type domain-containing protein n=1 Tax=Exophiala bonariae TaxID=1690606 RepID=A0AAV9N0L1_9EURO|nr:hypothetical protein LTR84_006630 [Exophiala bonariae]
MADFKPDESNHSGSVNGTSRSPTPRGKRKRYTTVACDECKKRKGKCDSQIPCQYCRDKAVICSYSSRLATASLQKERDFDGLNEKIERMQAQIDRLVADGLLASSLTKQPSTISTPASFPSSPGLNITHLHHQSDNNGLLRISSTTSRAGQPEFLGPTSSSFLFRMATTSLANAGIHTPRYEGLQLGPLSASTKVRYQAASSVNRDIENPLCTISRNEALRLLDFYYDEYGLIYPFIDKIILYRAAQYFYDCIDMASPSSTKTYPKDENTLTDGIWDILKLAIAIAAAIENHGPNALSAKLLRSVESGFDTRFLGKNVDLLEIQAWTAISILQFHLDEEVLAWRTIGLAGRAAIEQGLHRRETYPVRFSNDEQRLRASQLFWSIYILDRRWSFGTGRSFAIPECDVDLDVPTLGSTGSYLLSAMVAYAQLETRVWKVTTKTTAKATPEKLSFLYFRVQQWYRGIKPQYQLQPTEENMLQGRTPSENKIRLSLYLSVNQLQLFIFRHELLNSHTIDEDLPNARLAVEAAKDNIRLLRQVSQTPGTYSAQQAQFNHFLVSALAVLFLAVCHAPYQFSNMCREEFVVALELIQGFSSESHMGRRLWQRVQHLKEVGLSLGLMANKAQTVGMRDGALNSTDGNLPFLDFPSMERDQQPEIQRPAVSSEIGPPLTDETIDPYQLTNDLTAMFDTMQPSYKWPTAGEVASDPADNYQHAMNREISRDFLDFF